MDSSSCNLASEETSCRSVVQTFASVDSGAAGAGAGVASSTFVAAIFGTTIELERPLNAVSGFWVAIALYLRRMQTIMFVFIHYAVGLTRSIVGARVGRVSSLRIR